MYRGQVGGGQSRPEGDFGLAWEGFGQGAQTVSRGSGEPVDGLKGKWYDQICALTAR